MDQTVFFIVTITKEMVKKLDVSLINGALPSFLKKPNKPYSSMILLFDYNEDKREIYQIKEIRNYVKKLHTMYPFIWCFLFPHESPAIYPCICEDFMILKVDNKISVSISPKETKFFFKNLLEQLRILERKPVSTEHPVITKWAELFGLTEKEEEEF